MTIPLPSITEPDVHAVNACLNGTADPAAAKRAVLWILQEGCRHGATAPDRDDAWHHEGRRFVGELILKMKLPATLEAARERDKKVGLAIAAKRPTKRGTPP